MTQKTHSEPLWSIWARRMISVPVYFALATLCFVTIPLWMPLTWACDVATGKRVGRPRTRALSFFALYLACEVAGILAATGIWIGTLGGWIGGPIRFLDANAALQRSWSSALFRGSLFLFSMRVVVEGLELAKTGPLLLFVRHSSTADTVLAAALVANPNRLLLRYVLKRELLWDPCLDIVGRRLPNAFVDRSGNSSQAEVAAIARLAEGLNARSAVLIYPEGTRFSPDKLASSVAVLREKGLDELARISSGFQNVLPPRLGGSLALLDAATGVDLVVLEHTGFEGAANFPRFWSGALVGRTIRVRLRRISAQRIPAVDRDRWLFEIWSEADRWVSEAMSRENAE